MNSQITITSSPTKLSLFAGETGSYNLAIKNTGTALSLSISISVTSFPSGGSVSTIGLTFANHVIAKAKGTTVIPIIVAVGQSAVPGAYVLTATVSG